MKIKNNVSDFIWILPTIIFLLVVIIYPFTRAIILSFKSYSLSKPESLGNFIGFQNYVTLFKDQIFFNGIKVTLLIVISAVVFQIIIGFFIALFLNNNFKFQRIILTVFIIPTMLAPIVVGLIWRFLLYTQNGLLTYLVNIFGLFKDSTILSSPRLAVLAIILIDSWEWIPFIGLLFLSGLMALPEEPFEAAIIDGASKVGVMTNITIPLLRPVIVVATTFRFIDALKIFDTIFILTNGGPAGATDVINLYMYRLNFVYFDLGYGAAPAVLMIIVLVVITIAIYVNNYIKGKKIKIIQK